MNRLIIMLSASIIALSGCAIKPKQPNDLPATDYPSPRISDVSVPIDVSISGIRNTFEQNIPRHLGTIRGLGDDDTSFPLYVYDENNPDKNKDHQLYLHKQEYFKILKKELVKNQIPDERHAEIIASHETMIKEATPQQLSRIISVSYRLVATRGNFGLDFARDQIKASMPFNVDIRVDWSVCIGIWWRGKCRGVTIRHGQNGKVSGTGYLSSKVSINEQWVVKTKTRTNVDLRVATINIGPIRLSLRSLLSPIVNSVVRKAVRKIDNKIPGLIPLRREAEKAWLTFTQPHQASSSPDAWIQIVPSEFVWGGITKVGPDTARFGLGVKSWSKITLSDKPGAIDIGPLPKIVTRTPTGQFEINTPFIVDLDYASNIVANAMNGKTFNVKDNVTMEVDNIDLYVNGENIVVKTGFSADVPGRLFDVCGFMYFTGKPSYDKQGRVFSISNIDFDVNTNQKLLDAAAYLLHKPMVKELEKLMVVPLGKQLDEITKVVNEAVKDVKLGDKGRFKGNIQTIDIDNVYTAANKDVGVDIYLKGKSQVILLK